MSGRIHTAEGLLCFMVQGVANVEVGKIGHVWGKEVALDHGRHGKLLQNG